MADTVWLLDVDGVINTSRPGWGGPPRTATACADGTGWRMRWAQPLIDRIRQLAKSDLVEIRWCTTWCPWADQLEQLWHLPELGRAWDKDTNGMDAVRAKLDAAVAVVESGKRLIWTDDDIGMLPHPDILPAPGEKRDNALLIRPDCRCGLQPADMDAIDRFLGASEAIEVDRSTGQLEVTP